MENVYLPRVIHADYIGEYKIALTFDNGQKRVADCSKWVGGGIFEPLKDKSYFRRFFVDGWTVSWPNGADIAPETLYLEGDPA
jgi:hypothetical protein